MSPTWGLEMEKAVQKQAVRHMCVCVVYIRYMWESMCEYLCIYECVGGICVCEL